MARTRENDQETLVQIQCFSPQTLGFCYKNGPINPDVAPNCHLDAM